MIVKAVRLQYDAEGTAEVVLAIESRTDAQNCVQKAAVALAKGKTIVAEIKPLRRRRSLDANSYLWVLCQKIAEAVGTTKEEVYKKAVRDVGQFVILPIRDDAVETWIERWNSRGLGWFAEIMDDSKIPGYKKVITYYGSSVYDTREMSVLIDEIIYQCRELGIEHLPDAELQRLKGEWGKHDC